MKVIYSVLIPVVLCHVKTTSSRNNAKEVISGERSDRRIRSTCGAQEVETDVFAGAAICHDETYTPCGKNIKLEKTTGFIFTDEEVTGAGSWPWLVSIGDRGTWESTNKWHHKCGGSLITRQLVLTAGHCCIDDLVIRAGDGHLKNDCDDVGVQVVAVDSYIKHPKFSRRTRYFDIGVLKLASEVAYTRYVRPICPPDISLRSGDNNIHLVVAGWGADKDSQVGKNLTYASFQVYPQRYCNGKYLGQKGNELAVPDGFTDELLCGGDAAGSEGVCKGDSGSPAVFFNATEHRYTIKGVVSGGLSCGTRNHPNIYVRIGSPQILNWIREQINKIIGVPVPILSQDGGWSSWGSWGSCSATCGGANRRRTRTCSSPPPKNGGKKCAGLAIQHGACNLPVCGIAQVDKTCSATESCEKRKNCEPVQKKYAAIQEANTNKEKKKIIAELKSIICNKKKRAFCCQSGSGFVDTKADEKSGWGMWGAWSTCTKPCGVGEWTRRRYCTATDCHSQQDQTRFCNTHKC